MHHPKLVTISTKFNPTLLYNSKIRYPQTDKAQRFKFTEIQREKAKHAELAVDLDDFTDKVVYFFIRRYFANFYQIQDQLKKGRRQNDSKYIRLSSADLNG